MDIVKQAQYIMKAYQGLEKFLDDHGDEIGDQHSEWLEKLEVIFSYLDDGVKS